MPADKRKWGVARAGDAVVVATYGRICGRRQWMWLVENVDSATLVLLEMRMNEKLPRICPIQMKRANKVFEVMPQVEEMSCVQAIGETLRKKCHCAITDLFHCLFVCTLNKKFYLRWNGTMTIFSWWMIWDSWWVSPNSTVDEGTVCDNWIFLVPPQKCVFETMLKLARLWEAPRYKASGVKFIVFDPRWAWLHTGCAVSANYHEWDRKRGGPI